MSFFKPSPPEEKLSPRAAESKAGGKWLQDFMKSWGPAGSTTDYPTLQVAGLSAMQKYLRGKIQGYAEGGTEGRNLAMNEVRSRLGPNTDPRTSDQYKWFREEADDLRNVNVTASRQRQQMGKGTLDASPGMLREEEVGRKHTSQVLGYLDQMNERDLDRRDRAAEFADQMGQEDYGNTMASMGVAGMDREVEEQRNAANYNTMIQELLHQYTYQANIAAGMMGYSPGTWTKPGGESGLETVVNAVDGIMSIWSAYKTGGASSSLKKSGKK